MLIRLAKKGLLIAAFDSLREMHWPNEGVDTP